MELDDSIKTVKGIGDKTAAGFSRLGIYTVRDLLYTFPRYYLTYDDPGRVSDAAPGARCSVKARIISRPSEKRGRKFLVTTFTCTDGTSELRIIFFNSPYIKSIFHIGDTYVFVGRIKMSGQIYTMEMPEYYSAAKYNSMKDIMQPVYPLTAGIRNNLIKKTIGQVSFLLDDMEDYLPDEVRQKYGLQPLGRALQNIHFPRESKEMKGAVERLSFDEFFRFLYEIRRARERREVPPNEHPLKEGSDPDIFIRSLPFNLTKGQSDALDDIKSDMSGESPMNRLVQGDVGSGKTAVAAAAIYSAVKSGYQAALMAPTEVLAEQHYNDFVKMFEPFGMSVRLLTGSLPGAEKKRLYEEICQGACDIIIGTHALIQDKVSYSDLGLVICDEQHRFGVSQREKLREKGNCPHILIMSATPIPRTLALIIYADMDISVISEMPEGRKRIKNVVIGPDKRRSAYSFISGEIEKGHQAYIICPMIEDSDDMPLENVIDYSLSLSEYFPKNVRIRYLHGKLSEEEKSNILKAFINREIDILVSTTVIEVGINNPNATVMMIENSERFGLAQLHQLRGRVGRGKYQSYAIFVDSKQSKESRERLSVIENSNDGFFIAGEDLRLRGPGEFFGVRQSGDLPFDIADIYSQSDMLKAAQEAVLLYGDKVKLPGRDIKTM